MNEEQSPHHGWERRYLEGHTPWDRGEPSPALVNWVERGSIPRGRILVPGCGFGHEVVALCERGFEVTAIDFAPSAIEALGGRLRTRGLEAHLICRDWFEWLPEQSFDVVYEQTSLCSLPPARWREYAARLAAWLSPGGLLFALFMQTARPGGPPWHCDPVAMHRLFMPPAWRWREEPSAAVNHPAGFHELPAIIERRGGDRVRRE